MSTGVTAEIAAGAAANSAEGSPPALAPPDAPLLPRKHYTGAMDCLRSIVKEQGVAGLWGLAFSSFPFFPRLRYIWGGGWR